MRQAIRLLSIGSICFASCAFNFAQIAPAKTADAASAFETFKSLQGHWAVYSGNKALPVEVTYDLGSRDSIVTEQFGKELSVIYPDGPNLQMTHFCNAGNHPRLRWQQSGSPGTFEFDTFDVTNLRTPNADHVQRIIHRILDGSHLELQIVWKKNRGEATERYILIRK